MLNNAKDLQKEMCMYEEVEDFKLEVNSLKIVNTFPEMVTPAERSIMDVYVFL